MQLTSAVDISWDRVAPSDRASEPHSEPRSVRISAAARRAIPALLISVGAALLLFGVTLHHTATVGAVDTAKCMRH